MESSSDDFELSSSVSDLDDINAALNEDKNLLDNVDPTQVVEFAKIIDKYKGDVLGLTDYKKYQGNTNQGSTKINLCQIPSFIVLGDHHHHYTKGRNHGNNQ